MKAPVQRFLSALCALSFLLAALFPTAALAAGADDLAVSNTLTREDAAQMQEADSAVAALTDSGDFAALSRAERFAAAQAQLQQLAEQGLVSVRSIYIDEANGMVSFSYSCGVQGGILVDDPEEENASNTSEGVLTGIVDVNKGFMITVISDEDSESYVFGLDEKQSETYKDIKPGDTVSVTYTNGLPSPDNMDTVVIDIEVE